MCWYGGVLDRPNEAQLFCCEMEPFKAFQFSIRQHKGIHNILVVQVWNSVTDDEQTLIGTCRIPIPWIFNGFVIYIVACLLDWIGLDWIGLDWIGLD